MARSSHGIASSRRFISIRYAPMSLYGFPNDGSTAIARRPLVPRPFDRRERSLVERDLKGLARIADEFHEGEIVHAATARDQEARVRESGDELPRRRGIEHEDPVERLVGQRRKDADRVEPRRLHPLNRPFPAFGIRLDDDHLLRADDFREQGAGISAAAAFDEDPNAVL